MGKLDEDFNKIFNLKDELQKETKTQKLRLNVLLLKNVIHYKISIEEKCYEWPAFCYYNPPPPPPQQLSVNHS